MPMAALCVMFRCSSASAAPFSTALISMRRIERTSGSFHSTSSVRGGSHTSTDPPASFSLQRSPKSPPTRGSSTASANSQRLIDSGSVNAAQTSSGDAS
jgi:hypothetical protein